MAEKKFAGAPFGIQTARFDVTGVHPKTKVPGSFTQIPYDKYSMVEQRNDQLPELSKVEKLDTCLHNIRVALRSAKEDMIKMRPLLKTSNEEPNKKASNHGKKSTNISNDIKRSDNDLQISDSDVRPNGRHDNDTVSNTVTNLNKSGNRNSHAVLGNETSENVDYDRGAGQPSNTTVSSASLASQGVEPTHFPRISEADIENIVDVDTTLATVSDSLARASMDSNASGPTANPKILKQSGTGTAGKKYCAPPPNSCDYSGVPMRKPIVWTKREKRIPCDEFLKRKLGPGAYNTIVGGFSPNCVETRASGPGWARQLEVERLAALPHLLYKEQWEENKMLKRKLGPGSYEIKDFIQTRDLKPRSSRGICENLAQRFEKGVTHFTPGPGTYGVGGVPQRAMEEKCLMSTSTKGMLDSGDRKRNLPSVGSHLGPGTYRHKTCTEEMLNKVTSLKGPYELYSGDRNKPISEGYQAAPKLADLGPGQYEIGSFVDELHGVHKKSHGVFGKMTQYPEVPTERLFLFSQQHCPKKRDIPGPGSYSMQEASKPQAVGSPGFLSSAKRDDKLSQKFFTRNFNPVGAGRYDIQKFHEAQDVNGHTSAFKSRSGKPGLHMAKFLQERIRAKDVPVQDRMFITEPEKPALSRSVTVM